ncbi:hypothetical protein B7435_16795 [Mycolicibacterium peregrinum]|nr:hypothetical protein B7435_16795 [Mycolicibacterium peregrinum]
MNNLDVGDTVERALKAGQRREDIDMVVRARYAYQWGGGDALHLELADEVERLRALAGVVEPTNHTRCGDGNDRHTERSEGTRMFNGAGGRD